MRIGIRPINDFAFKKIFGTVANKLALISFLNAVLCLGVPIVEVTIANPYNLQDFLDDKLSILDIKAIEATGAIYDIEMQLTIFEGLVQRIVFYGCEMYAGQLNSGDDYAQLNPVYSICLVNGVLWKDAKEVHHSFRLTDQDSGRSLDGTIEIHTLELGMYNLNEADLPNANMLDRWLYWFLHAHEYETDALLRLFPEDAMQLATKTITKIAEITEDKSMYDAREKALRDQQWAINAAHREGKVEGKLEGKLEGKIELVRTLEGILGVAISKPEDLQSIDLDGLQTMIISLQERIRNRA
jgi:predicted transposase/invertase (TIGR01784 family)